MRGLTLEGIKITDKDVKKAVAKTKEFFKSDEGRVVYKVLTIASLLLLFKRLR